MSKGAKFRQLIVHRIYQKTGKIFSTRELDSVFRDSILSDDILRFIEEDHEWFEAFENTVEYIDDIRNPFGILKHLRTFFEENGRYTYRTIKEKVENTDGTVSIKDKQIVDYYTPNDPDLFVIVKVDNINLLTPEKGSTIYDAIQSFSSDHMLRVRDRWNGIPVIIQQQALSKEGNDSIRLGRTRPSADGLADNKATSKDANVFMGLYSPYRNGIDTYNNYNIKALRDHYRSFYIDFDRDGASCETNLYFHGAVTQFRELPKPNDMTKQMYDNIHSVMNPNK